MQFTIALTWVYLFPNVCIRIDWLIDLIKFLLNYYLYWGGGGGRLGLSWY